MGLINLRIMKIRKKQIAEVLAHFDFDRVAKIYDMLDWRWRDEGVPGKKELVAEATRLLNDLKEKWPKTHSIECGGLRAKAHIEEGLFVEVKLEFIAHSAVA